jgi:hypothetical protein
LAAGTADSGAEADLAPFDVAIGNGVAEVRDPVVKPTTASPLRLRLVEEAHGARAPLGKTNRLGNLATATSPRLLAVATTSVSARYRRDAARRAADGCPIVSRAPGGRLTTRRPPSTRSVPLAATMGPDQIPGRNRRALEGDTNL